MAALAAGLLVLGAMLYAAGLSIDPLAFGSLRFAAVFATLGLIRWACRNPRFAVTRVVGDTAEYFGLFTAISLVGAVASYPIAAFNHGFVDDLLVRSDRALRFDWLAWYQLVATHPLLQQASRVAYSMIYVSPAILLFYFAVLDRRREAYDFIASVAIAAAITLTAFRFMPAVGPFAQLWHGPIPYMPISELWQPSLIPQLRDHSFATIELDHLVGLVSAPSFHTAAGVLLIAAARRHVGIRVPLILANIAMLLATPVEGTHYVTDMILGALVAFVALAIIAIARFSGPARGPVPSRA